MLALIAVIIAAILLLPSCGSRGGKAEADTESTTLVKAGDKAPDFTVEMFDGTKTSLAELKGKVVLLNFWATWCPPCRSEMPELNTFAQKHKEKVQFYGVNLQEEGDKVQGFLKDNGYTMPVLLDQEGKAATLYKVRVIPTTVILDEKGNILQRHEGVITAQQLETLLKGKL